MQFPIKHFLSTYTINLNVWDLLSYLWVVIGMGYLDNSRASWLALEKRKKYSYLFVQHDLLCSFCENEAFAIFNTTNQDWHSCPHRIEFQDGVNMVIMIFVGPSWRTFRRKSRWIVPNGSESFGRLRIARFVLFQLLLSCTEVRESYLTCCVDKSAFIRWWSLET